MSEYLVHYGVKGMKWGKRKAKVKTGVLDGFREKANDVSDAVGRELDRHADKHLKEGFKYASVEDAVKYAKIMARIDANRAEIKHYIDRGKTEVKSALKSLTKFDLKRARDHGKAAVDSFFSALRKWSEGNPERGNYYTIDSGAGTYRTQTWSDGTKIRYKK